MTSLLAAALLAQAKPWTPPPNALPPAFIEAAAFLLTHGMGDPRGGEFREATAATTDRRTKKPRVVWGWVFSDRTPACVVTTEGLVLPVASIGKALDLETFVQGQIASTAPHNLGLAGESLQPVFAALLLIDGKPQLAKRVLGTPDEESIGREALLDLLGAESAQAKDAFVQGDDALASRLARLAAEGREAFKAEAKRLSPHVAIPQNFDLATLLMDEIAVDAARRVGRPRPPLDLPALEKRSVPERVAELIDRLDDARAEGPSFDGRADPAADPIVAALAAIGDPAVGPLIDCVERDRRLTRIGQMTSSDWYTIFHFVSVREAAYRALQEALKIPDLPRADDGPGLRRFWTENAGLTPAGRWLRVLQDDEAGVDAWRQMAWNLFGYGGSDRSFPRPRPLPAEALRGPDRAALTRILDRRIEDALADSRRGDSIQNGVEAALTFAEDRAQWDPTTALPSLRKATRAAMAPETPLAWLDESFVRAMESRARLEGGAAWNEYAAWVERTRLTPMTVFQTRAFRLLVDHRDVPRLRKAMRTLFAASDSSWTVARVERGGGWWWIADYLRSPLLADGVFRAAVFAALDDRTVVGKATVRADGAASFVYDRSSSGFPAQWDPKLGIHVT